VAGGAVVFSSRKPGVERDGREPRVRSREKHFSGRVDPEEAVRQLGTSRMASPRGARVRRAIRPLSSG
jgi:hypothetical protein